VVNVMKQSGCDVPAWMDELPKLTKRDKRRIKQQTVQRREIDSESKIEKNRRAHKRYFLGDVSLTIGISSKTQSKSQESKMRVVERYQF
jgi:hypothetical protein